MIFCKHNWQLISETKTESMLEQMDRIFPEKTQTLASVKEFLLQKKLIQIVECNRCGKIKKFVEDI